MARVADYIFNRLFDEGVGHIFMVTGRGSLFLTDAVAKHEDLIGVSVHHEQAAAYSAVAYSQYNDQLGACLVSTGCAATNAITGVLNAWQDGIPCVFISGQNTLAETTRHTGIPLRTFGQQESDIISLVEPITKYSIMITNPNQIAYELDKALYFSQNGRKGPVWIDIPLDIQNMRVVPEELERFLPTEQQKFDPSIDDIEYVYESLRKAQRPIILIGNGIRSADAIEVFSEFLNKHPIPVVYSASAPDTYGSEHNLSIGSVGIMGCSRAGNFAIQNSDLILVLGNRLSPMTTGSDYCKFGRDAKLIVVDIDSVEHSKETVTIDKTIIADAGKFLKKLLDLDIKSANKEWQDKCLHWKKVFPKCEDAFRNKELIDLYYLSEVLSENLQDSSVVVTDSGLVELILPTNISFKKGMRSIHPASQGSMGYALPAAVGVSYASKQSVITVIGDGSVMMNLQELETIRHNKLPIKIIIINNNVYSVIRKRQVDLFRRRTIGTDPDNGVSCPDFSKVADTFDMKYLLISKPSELQKKIKKLLDMDGPVLCEIMSPENQDYITIAHSRTLKGGAVRRPIEDQAPFLDRDIFLSEMVIEPIDQ
jgi:acetolactate synthase I/II/III large subunit